MLHVAESAVSSLPLILLAQVEELQRILVMRRDGCTLLKMAASMHHVEIVDALLTAAERVHLELIDEEDGSGRDILNCLCADCGPRSADACQQRQKTIIVLLNHGANPYFRPRDGDSAIFYASYLSAPMLYILAPLPAHTIALRQHYNDRGESPLHVACSGGNVEAVKYLVAADNVQFPEQDEIAGRDTPPLPSHMVHKRCVRGRTPLHVALQMNERHCVAAILDSCTCLATINPDDGQACVIGDTGNTWTDNNGNTLLHTACAESSHGALAVLIEKGCDTLNLAGQLRHCNDFGHTPFDVATAAGKDNSACLELLHMFLATVRQ